MDFSKLRERDANTVPVTAPATLQGPPVACLGGRFSHEPPLAGRSPALSVAAPPSALVSGRENFLDEPRSNLSALHIPASISPCVTPLLSPAGTALGDGLSARGGNTSFMGTDLFAAFSSVAVSAEGDGGLRRGPTNPAASHASVVARHPLLMGADPLPPSTAFSDPDSWQTEFKALRAATVKNKDLIVLSHKPKADITTKPAARSACCVRVLPGLDAIKAALKKPAADRRRQRYDMWESVSNAGGASDDDFNTPGSWALSRRSTRSRSNSPRLDGPGGSASRPRGRRGAAPRLHMAAPAIWAVGGINSNDIHVNEAFSGRPLMRIRDPKANVPAVSVTHAPFRGFMNRQLKVLPVQQPSDLLRLKSAQLIETDWVWVGFSDGSLRMFPANPARIRESDRAEQFAKGELADLVFELPKYHNASIVAIARSPCHRDDDGADLSTINRLSTAVQYMTAAGRVDSDKSREHLSLMCIASVDSSIVVWDVRRIYQTLEAMRAAKKEELMLSAGGCGMSPGQARRAAVPVRNYGGSVYSGEVIGLEGFAGDGGAAPFSVRSTCTMIKVRPLMRLKGGVASLKSLQWVSTLVTTEEYERRRRVADMTRNAEEPSAPKLIRDRRPTQNMTRFEQREDHRRALGLRERGMREVEEELVLLMPPVMDEPVQSLRVNLLVAGDNIGTVHVWNLDEELARKINDPFNDQAPHVDSARGHGGGGGGSARTGRSTVRHGSESPGRSSVAACSVVSPSVQLSAIGGPTAGRTKRATTPSRSVAAESSVRGKSPSMTAARKNRKKPNGNRAAPATMATRPTLSGATPKRSTRPGAGGRGHTPGGRTTTAAADDATARRAGRASSSRVVGGSRAAHSVARAGSVRAVEAADPLNGQSKLQVIAAQRSSRSMSMREVNCIMDSPSQCRAEGSPDGGGRRSVSVSLASPRSPRTGAGGGSRRGPAKSQRPPGPSHASSMAAATPRASRLLSPSRDQETYTTVAAAASGRRHGSPAKSQPRTLNEYLSRTSRCRIEFTGGVGINGMAVDVPSRLQTTLRRVPDPEDRLISLLDTPTPEEVEQRVLENSFEALTEDRALFFVFQHLQLYLAVEGTVLNLRCVPEWHQLDGDGRGLFAERGDRESAKTVGEQLLREAHIGGRVELTPAFSIGLRKMILETHSQPVTELFLDHGRGHLWVARNDGLMALFCKRTKKIVTRVPHPCAEAALGPPNQKDWRSQQRELLREFNSGTAPRLDWHKESRGFPATAHFSELVPFGRRTQVGMLLTANVLTATSSSSSTTEMVPSMIPFHRGGVDPFHHTGNHSLAATPSPHHAHFSEGPVGHHSTPGRSPVPYSLSSLMRLTSNYMLDGETVTQSVAALGINGCSDLSSHARRREEHFGALLHKLLWCRRSADALRSTQKTNYEATCDTIGSNVHYVMRELGAYSALSKLNRAYDQWFDHARRFPRAHVMRTQRTDRLKRSSGAAAAMGRAVQLRTAAGAFRRWLAWAADAKPRRSPAVAAMLAPLRREVDLRRMRIAAALSLHLLQTQARCRALAAWGEWARSRRTRRLQLERNQRTVGWYDDASLQGDSSARASREAASSSSPFAMSSEPSPEAPESSSRASTAVPPQPPAASRGPSPLVRMHTRLYRHSASPPARRKASSERNSLGAPDSGSESRSMSHRGSVGGGGCDDVMEEVLNGTTAAVGADPLTESHPFITDFLAMLKLLYLARPSIMRFRESRTFPDSLLDESWMSIVESAEGAAVTRDDAGRRLAVFAYGLLPLLQGLLSTADDVLPNLHDDSVAEEVISMLNGIQLCMDYVGADPEDALMDIIMAKSGPNADGGSSLYFSSPDKVFLRVLGTYAKRALGDSESAKAIKEIADERDSLEAFIAFVDDDRLDSRRGASVSLR